jgi:hypothetical protein
MNFRNHNNDKSSSLSLWFLSLMLLIPRPWQWQSKLGSIAMTRSDATPSSLIDSTTCPNVATLALGSRPRQGLARMRAKMECGRVWEWTLTLPRQFPLWELESRWIPEPSESDCKGQNPLPWGVLYIIGKIWKLRCLKWARMTHLDI